MFFDDCDVFFFLEGFGEVGGFAAISYEIYKFTCCFAVKQKTFWRGGSQSHECVSMTYFEDLSKQSAFGGCVLLESEGGGGALPSLTPQILPTCPRHHHPPPKSSEH